MRTHEKVLVGSHDCMARVADFGSKNERDKELKP